MDFLSNRKQRVILLVLFIFTLVINLDAAKRKSQPTITIKSADRQEITGNTFIADGNVEIAWEGYKIYADHLEFNRETKKLLASGRVTMTSKETVITGDKFTFNLKKRSGEMVDTYGQLAPTVRYTTDKLTHVDKDTLAFKKLDFTPCSQCVPRWKITCSNGKIKKEKYIEMKNVLFKIKKVPVFYLPYLRYPIDKDGRSTGFLLPVMGNSSQKGFFVQNAFYWAIKPNVDLTVNFDYYSKAGTGAAPEFRYLAGNMDGNIKFYYFNYKKDFNFTGAGQPGQEVPADGNIKTRKYDYFFKVKHKQKIDWLNTRVTVDIDKQSNANFLRLFSADFDNISNRIFRSSASISSSLSNLKFSISASQNDTLKTSENELSSIRYLPSINMNLNQQKIWKLPGYFSLSTSYSLKSEIKKSYEEESETDAALDAADITDTRSARLRVSPSYTLSLLSPWLNANLVLQSSHSFYPQSRLPGAEELVVVDKPLYLQHQTANFTLKGPVFSRIFESKTSRIKHLIEPRVTFRYATKVEEEERGRLIIPGDFAYTAYSYVGFSINTRLLFKGKKSKGSAREILSYTIRQDYYIDPVLANKNLTVLDLYPEFSQLSNTLRLRPFRDFSLDATLDYSHYLHAFSRMLVTLGYTNKKSPLTGNFKYTKYINRYRYNPEEPENNSKYKSETIGGSLNFEKKGFPLKFKARTDYDIQNIKFRYGSFGLGYDYQCITFNAELKLFEIAGKLEKRFNVGFTLGNLGMVKDLLGSSK